MLTAVVVAAAAWLVSTLISIVTGLVFLHGQGYSSQLTHWGVDRAIMLNLGAYVIWAVFGVGFAASYVTNSVQPSAQPSSTSLAPPLRAPFSTCSTPTSSPRRGS